MEIEYLEGLVSIIMPAYNAGEFISESIKSIQNQTYKNWELIITDDCSSDDTEKIAKSFACKDDRIKFHKLIVNSGAAVTRNESVKIARGQYIAFLDSDDLWLPEKLERQLSYMKTNGSAFCCTFYERINEKGQRSGVVVKDSKIKTYEDLLRNCPGNSTIIYDASKIGKHYGINIRKRNDYVLWLSVIKDSKELSCLDDVLTLYRVREGSISSHKLKLIKYHWNIYRNIEKINAIMSTYLVIYWCLKGVVKKITRK